MASEIHIYQLNPIPSIEVVQLVPDNISDVVTWLGDVAVVQQSDVLTGPKNLRGTKITFIRENNYNITARFGDYIIKHQEDRGGNFDILTENELRAKYAHVRPKEIIHAQQD